MLADCLQLLLSHIKIDIDGNTSIHEAYVSSNISCGRILLEAKADISTKNDDGNTSSK